MPSNGVRLAIDLPAVSSWLSGELGYKIGDLDASQFDAGQRCLGYCKYALNHLCCATMCMSSSLGKRRRQSA